MKEEKIIVTLLGADKVGIVAELTATLTPLFDVMCNENTLCKICVW